MCVHGGCTHMPECACACVHMCGACACYINVHLCTHMAYAYVCLYLLCGLVHCNWERQMFNCLNNTKLFKRTGAFVLSPKK